jgi:hypothetical protein
MATIYGGGAAIWGLPGQVAAAGLGLVSLAVPPLEEDTVDLFGDRGRGREEAGGGRRSLDRKWG